MTRIPILMYHALWPAAEDAATRERRFASDPQLCDPGARLYAFSDEVLALHMQAIQAEGYASIDRWQQLSEPSTGRRILITFDDGHLSNFTIALQVLKAHGLRAAFFITTDWIGSHGFMNEAQIRQLRDSGMLIGAHGCSHRYLAALSREEALEEMVRSRRRLGEILGEPPEAMSLPGGWGNRQMRDLARQAGYRHLFTSRIGLAKADGNPMDWPRVPMTDRQPHDFVPNLLRGDLRQLRRIALGAAVRRKARQLLGVRLYDRLRGAMLGADR